MSSSNSDDSKCQLKWLDGVLFMALTEFGYYIDAKGELILYYALHRVNSTNFDCILKLEPNGLLRCIEVDNFTEQFGADHSGYYNTTSTVFQEHSTSSKKRLLLGYVEKRKHIKDDNGKVILSIYYNKSEGNSSPLYILRPYSPQWLSAKIAAAPKHHCLLLMFHDRLDVNEKAMVICLAVKVYRQYYKLNLDSLQCYAGTKGALSGSLQLIRKNLTLKVDERNDTWHHDALSSSELKECNEEVIELPKFDSLTQLYIQNVGYTHQIKSHYFSVKESLNARPVLIIDCRLAEVLYGYIRHADTLEKMFYLDNVTPMEVRSQIFYEDKIIGYLEKDAMFDAENKQIMFGCFQTVQEDRHCRFLCTIYENYTSDGSAQAYISYNKVDRHISLTMRPELPFVKKVLTLAIAIKFMYSVCKVEKCDGNGYSSMEEMIQDIENHCLK